MNLLEAPNAFGSFGAFGAPAQQQPQQQQTFAQNPFL
jgi:hypothetical protein